MDREFEGIRRKAGRVGYYTKGYSMSSNDYAELNSTLGRACNVSESGDVVRGLKILDEAVGIAKRIVLHSPTEGKHIKKDALNNLSSINTKSLFKEEEEG